MHWKRTCLEKKRPGHHMTSHPAPPLPWPWPAAQRWAGWTPGCAEPAAASSPPWQSSSAASSAPPPAAAAASSGSSSPPAPAASALASSAALPSSAPSPPPPGPSVSWGGGKLSDCLWWRCNYILPLKSLSKNKHFEHKRGKETTHLFKCGVELIKYNCQFN